MDLDVILKDQIEHPCAWRGPDFQNDSSWQIRLSDPDVASLDDAVKQLAQSNKSFPTFGRADFPLSGLRPMLIRLQDELENGRGFALLRGLPVEAYSENELNTIYYGIGLNLGIPVRQNPAGDLIGGVMNVGDVNDKNTRVYETNRYLPYHTDPSDVFALLCVRKARRGGLNSLVSAATVYNEILNRYPEYLALLYRPMWYAHLGEDLPSLSPIFSFHQGKLACRYLRQYIELGHDVRDLPLSNIEIEALDLIDSITHDDGIRLDMMLEPGDILVANNYCVMHSRTAFEDHQQPDARRKLLRLWLKMENARQLSPEFPGRNGFGPPPTY